MITVHISPSEEKVYIEHTMYGNLVVSPEQTDNTTTDEK
jgi:hypothetical protein